MDADEKFGSDWEDGGKEKNVERLWVMLMD
jgi:hypothetical protein